MKYYTTCFLFTMIAAQSAITFSNTTAGYLASGTAGPAGLQGSAYDFDGIGGANRFNPAGSTNPLAIGGWADNNAFNTTADGTFTATVFNYSGNDNSNYNTWLGSDAGTFSGTMDVLGDSVTRFQGYIQITTANTVINLGLNSDDGSRFYIGTTDILETSNGSTYGNTGTVPANNDGGHGNQLFTNAVTFADAGYYPVDIRYYDGAWQDGSNPPNIGGATLQVNVNGAIYNAANPGVSFVQSVVPEPTTFALGGLALLGLARRRRRA
jgi:hypothetical protein